MRYGLLILAIICCALTTRASSLDTAKGNNIRSLTLRGLEYAYNLDFVNANRVFDEAHAVEPLHPRPLLGKASMLFWRLMIQKDDSSYERLLSQADDIIDSGEHFLDRYGKDADVYTCLGSAYAYRAFAHARMKSYLKAAWDGKKSYDYFDDAIKLDHQAYDAYAGIGVFHYFTTFMPKALQWVTSILGVPGDSERGIREIRTTAEKGTYSNVESKFYLAELLPWYNEDFDSSEAILRELAVRYPSNSLFNFTLAVWQIRRNDVQSAKQLLLKLSDEEHKAIPALQQFVNYKLAECYFRLGDFGHAQECYTRFLKDYHDDLYRATSNYRIGISMELAGKRDDAQKYYKLAASAKSRHGDDRYSARKADNTLRFGLAPDDSLLLSAQNMLCSGNYAGAIPLFTLLRSRPGVSNILKAEAVYGLGQISYLQGSYAEALKSFLEVASMQLPQSDEWLVPWSHYFSGLCSEKMHDAETAKRSFEKTTDYDDYDFENWLNYRAKQELEHLKK